MSWTTQGLKAVCVRIVSRPVTSNSIKHTLPWNNNKIYMQQWNNNREWIYKCMHPYGFHALLHRLDAGTVKVIISFRILDKGPWSDVANHLLSRNEVVRLTIDLLSQNWIGWKSTKIDVLIKQKERGSYLIHSHWPGCVRNLFHTHISKFGDCHFHQQFLADSTRTQNDDWAVWKISQQAQHISRKT